MQENNFISLGNFKNTKYSQVGNEIKDVLLFVDQSNNKIDIPSLTDYNVIFVHINFPEIMYQAELSINQKQEIIVKWTPYIKGYYQMYINNILCGNGKSLLVIGGKIDLGKTDQKYQSFLEQDNESVKKIGYFEKISMDFQFRDQYLNSYSNTENQILNYNEEIVTFSFESDDWHPAFIKHNYSQIDKAGKQSITIEIVIEDSDEYNEISGKFKVFIDKYCVKEDNLVLYGLGLDKRIEKFQEELKTLKSVEQFFSSYFLEFQFNKKIQKKGSVDLKVNRQNLIKYLLYECVTKKEIKQDKKEEEKKDETEKKYNIHTFKYKIRDLNRLFYIQFLGEYGIVRQFLAKQYYKKDAGGLRREFFDFFGSALKNQQNFFIKSYKSDEEQYLINPEALKDPQSLEYYYIFGQLFANSFVNQLDKENQVLIGFNFAEPFWKYMLGQDYGIEDLHHIWDENTFKNYMLYWNSSKEEVEELGIELNLKINEKVIQYKDYQSYIWGLAEQEFSLRTKKLQDIFRQGFNNIFDINILKKYFSPKEIAVLTSGEKKITAEKLEKFINYRQGNSLVHDFFKRYLNESEEEMLEKFLKFTTGSSRLPYESHYWKIEVNFRKAADVKSLPIAHTCSKELEIPMYKSYEMLKKMCDIAFTSGLDGGFGFA